MLPAMTALGGSILRLEQRKSIEAPDMGQYFTSPNTWYQKTGDESGLRYFYRNSVGVESPLTEKSIDAMLNDLLLHGRSEYVVRPTKMIVSPAQYKAYMAEREHLRTWWERLWTRILPA